MRHKGIAKKKKSSSQGSSAKARLVTSRSSDASKKSKLQKPTPASKKSSLNSNGMSNGHHKSDEAPGYYHLSEEAKDNLRFYLDTTEKPFQITTTPASRKRKRDEKSKSDVYLQTDLWEDRLSVQYAVRPKDRWDSLRRYKKFTVGSDSIGVGQCILVKHDDTEEVKIDLANQWKAKVLEVRAMDSEHVYIRVAWLNRPEDLAGGRKSYHGRNELIPTNQMDIIDAMAVNGSMDVACWDDAEDETATISEDQYFWRQTFDYAVSKTFSKLRHICVDKAPQNPDEMILQCSNAACRRWLHAKCCAEQAVQQAAAEYPSTTKTPTPLKPSKHFASVPTTRHDRTRSHHPSLASKRMPAAAKAHQGRFIAAVYIKDVADEPLDDPGSANDSNTDNIQLSNANDTRDDPANAVDSATNGQTSAHTPMKTLSGAAASLANLLSPSANPPLTPKVSEIVISVGPDPATITSTSASSKPDDVLLDPDLAENGSADPAAAHGATTYAVDLRCLFCGVIVD